jgi:hypothetical protein
MSPTEAVKERPILMSGEDVRAILDGRKSQFRRVMKYQPEQHGHRWVYIYPHAHGYHEKEWALDAPTEQKWITEDCPYGQPGDRLWCRETWGVGGARLVDPCLNYRADGGQRPIYRIASDAWRVRNGLEVSSAQLIAVLDGWHSSIHMPRWASRLLLEITEVRVQRVQDISREDARAEGALPGSNPIENHYPAPMGGDVRAYRALWGTLNAKHPWESNPWVWAISFSVSGVSGEARP